MVSGGFLLFQREFAERYLDDSPELLLDQLPLQRVARDGQRGIFDYGGF
jgi:glucose-1-phosphate cytidylyltransferase